MDFTVKVHGNKSTPHNTIVMSTFRYTNSFGVFSFIFKYNSFDEEFMFKFQIDQICKDTILILIVWTTQNIYHTYIDKHPTRFMILNYIYKHIVL